MIEDVKEDVELVTVQEVTLTRHHFQCERRVLVDRRAARLSHLNLAQMLVDEATDSMIVQLEHAVYGQQLENVEISYPADWWQAWKERFFGERALARWPVRYTTQVVHVLALYPRTALTDQPAYLYARVDKHRDRAGNP